MGAYDLFLLSAFCHLNTLYFTLTENLT